MPEIGSAEALLAEHVETSAGQQKCIGAYQPWDAIFELVREYAEERDGANRSLQLWDPIAAGA